MMASRRITCLVSAACLSFVLALPGCTDEAPPPPNSADVAAAEAAANLLGGRLKSRLVSAMTEGGPFAAIDVCAREAGIIAQTVSEETGYDVGRTALRVRNSSNVADAWDHAQLQRFVEALSNGASPTALTAAEVVNTNGAQTFRWARAIVMEPVCTVCHGTDVDPDLESHIQSLYPADAATGFEVGALRGAFTIQRTLLDE